MNINPNNRASVRGQNPRNNNLNSSIQSKSWFASIQNKFSIDAKFSSDRLTLIKRMAGDGFVVGVWYCLVRGADVNLDHPGRTYSVLHWTVSFAEPKKDNYVQITKLLLSYGANVNDRHNFSNETALHEAAQKGNARIARVLLEHGADANVKRDASHLTPLYDATHGFHLGNYFAEHVEVVQLLLQYGADVNAADSFRGNTALFQIMRNSIQGGFSQSNKRHCTEEFYKEYFLYKMVRSLLLYKADIYIQNGAGDSAFSYFYDYHLCTWACGKLPHKKLFDEFILGLDVNQLKDLKRHIQNDINSPEEEKFFNKTTPIPEDKKELYISNLNRLVAQINYNINLIKSQIQYTKDPRLATLSIVALKKGFSLPPEIMNKIKEYDFDFSMDKIHRMKGFNTLKSLDTTIKYKLNIVQKIVLGIVTIFMWIRNTYKFILNFF